MELNIGCVDWCPGIDTANVPTFADLRIDTLNQELAEPESTSTLKLCNLYAEVRFVKFGSLVALNCDEGNLLAICAHKTRGDAGPNRRCRSTLLRKCVETNSGLFIHRAVSRRAYFAAEVKIAVAERDASGVLVESFNRASYTTRILGAFRFRRCPASMFARSNEFAVARCWCSRGFGQNESSHNSHLRNIGIHPYRLCLV